ncbi:hypothetical protein BDZ91DRAFT_740029 [Kalaharituber pfeilii]|nr:hypothetical protein BDZ91DRAFT_740029 [Kalaharituber pfeilii]
MAQTRPDFCPRDQDLVGDDDFLTESKLDSLWEWFCDANQDKVSPQMIFAKLVNASRKPYCDDVEALRKNLVLTEDELRASRATINQLQECIRKMNEEQHGKQQWKEDEKIQLEQDLKKAEKAKREYEVLVERERRRLELDFKNMKDQLLEYRLKVEVEKMELGRNLDTLKAQMEKSSKLGSQRIVLKPRNADNYLGIQKGGRASLTSLALPFLVIRYPDGMVSLQAATCPGTYLSAGDPQIIENKYCLGGIVRLSETCDKKEKFWVHEDGEVVHFESVNFPGFFLKGLYGHFTFRDFPVVKTFSLGNRKDSDSAFEMIAI